MTNLTECIAPAFYPVHNAIKRENITHYWLKGGRGSTKSSFAAVEIILGMMQHPDANAVCLRKVGLYLKDSVYEQLVWAISKLGVSHLWEQRISPMMLIYMPTGQRILFRGADKPKKIKSTKVSKGYIRYIWYEECDEFLGKGEIDTINQSLMRGGDKFDIFYSYNPPKSQTNWINREIELQQTRSDTLVHHSDYQSVPESWLGEPFLQEAEQLQATNEIRYLHEYLGEVTGTGGEATKELLQKVEAATSYLKGSYDDFLYKSSVVIYQDIIITLYIAREADTDEAETAAESIITDVMQLNKREEINCLYMDDIRYVLKKCVASCKRVEFAAPIEDIELDKNEVVMLGKLEVTAYNIGGA